MLTQNSPFAEWPACPGPIDLPRCRSEVWLFKLLGTRAKSGGALALANSSRVFCSHGEHQALSFDPNYHAQRRAIHILWGVSILVGHLFDKLPYAIIRVDQKVLVGTYS